MASTLDSLDDLISATRIRLRRCSPFFAALAMFAQHRFSDDVPLAATDGRLLLFNPQTYGVLKPEERDALFLHVLLHAALLHPLRRGVRDEELFNIAADIVVNGMLAAEPQVKLPKGAIRDQKLEHLSVEEIYELLQKNKQAPRLPLKDLIKPGSSGSPPGEQKDEADGPGKGPAKRKRRSAGDAEAGGDGEDKNQKRGSSDDEADHKGKTSGDGQGSGKGDAKNQSQSEGSFGEGGPEGELHALHDHSALEAHWKQAIQQARVLVRSQGQGSIPAGLQRHLGEIADPQIDWRSMLWRYLVRTPTDFSGFDRRFIYQGLYIDHLEGESVQVFCCIDTSGSIDDELIRTFLGELTGILASYPMLECQLWYADAECYGPYEIDSLDGIPKPEGGGGTDFCPFLAAAAKAWSGEKEAVCVYLTDGYGEFPRQPPELPVLWVICPGGLPSEEIPFGEVCRLI